MALAVTLLVCEIAIRMSGVVANTTGPWDEIATPYKVRTNLEGFRDCEHNLDKTDGVFRIMVAGDSFTWGLGVDQDKTYPRLLQDKLNATISGHRFEIINNGKYGWCTEEEFSYFQKKGVDYRPDLLIIGYVLNDPEPRDWDMRWRSDWVIPSWIRWLSQKSQLYRLLLIQYNYFYYDRINYEGSWTYYIKSLYDEDAPNWANFEAAVKGFCDLARQNGMEVVTVIFPIFSNDLGEGYPFRKEHEIAKQVWLRHGARVLDLYPVFRDMDGGKLRLSMSDNHPNATAHAIAADTVYDYLLAQKLVPTEGLNVPLPAMANPHEANFGNLIKLLGYTLNADHLTSGDTVRLILYWQALTEIESDYTVFVHLLDEEGAVVAQHDSTPVKGVYPTSAWRPGETMVDGEYVLPLTGIAPGRYTIEVGLYHWKTLQRLDVLDWAGNPQDTRVLLADVWVE